MKKILMFSLVVFLLISCGGKGQSPTDNVTLGQAMAHCSHSFTYWLFIVISVALGAFASYRLIKANSDDWSGWNTAELCILAAFIIASFIARPGEIAQNTTVEQANRGAWIGY